VDMLVNRGGTCRLHDEHRAVVRRNADAADACLSIDESLAAIVQPEFRVRTVENAPKLASVRRVSSERIAIRIAEQNLEAYER